MIPPLNNLFSDPSRKLCYTGSLLCLDPGETTGYAVFTCRGYKEPIMEDIGQIDTKTPDVAANNLEALFSRVRPEHVVCEDYKVYTWKQEQHTHSDLMTPQVIGMIKFLCAKLYILPTMQMAAQAKGFVDDDKIKAWGFWIRGKRHARDAIRHGIYYLLFTYQNKKERDRQDDYRSKRPS